MGKKSILSGFGCSMVVGVVADGLVLMGYCPTQPSPGFRESTPKKEIISSGRK